ncbi:MAG: UDP-N-acetylglucosamine diphosphorylase [Opitutales bacterium]
MLKARNLFQLPDSLPFSECFCPDAPPWEWTGAIREALASFDFPEKSPEHPPGLKVEGPVFFDPSVQLPPYGVIQGPAYIGADVELRPGVYVRGNVIAGAGSVLGNSCEFKNCLLLEGVQVPHFSYVGDSVLGNKAHLGAGVICSNLRLDQETVGVRLPDGSRVDTGLRKLGALLGDGAEVGCNAVLNPGAILGRRALVMPAVMFTGWLDEGMMAGTKPDLKRMPRR